LRARVTERHRGDAVAKAAPELEEDVSADGATYERGLADAGGVEDPDNVASVFLHKRGPIADFRIAVAAKIGKNQPVAGLEGHGRWVPELVIRREGVEKYDRRAVSPNFISDFGVVAAEVLHQQD